MESAILQELNWDISVTTAAHFLETFFELNDFTTFCHHPQRGMIHAHIQSQASYLHSMCLQDMAVFVSHSPSVLAASILLVARVRLRADVIWPEPLQSLTGYSESQLASSSGQLWRLGKM